jgi:alanine transaminase
VQHRTLPRFPNFSSLPHSPPKFCNIGNPQELQQPPITFFRQVLSILNYPELASATSFFPPDVISRAKRYLKRLPGGLGAYTHSQGIELIREEVAEFISKRDGVPAFPRDVYLCDGASPGVQAFLKALIRNKKDGVMVPIPQYPLYSASIALFGGSMINYYLNEERGWRLEADELERSIQEARAQGLNVRCIVVINPGNPTGNVLQEANMREVVAFAARHGLVLIADEVYQVNVWDATRKFTSFKKVAHDMGLIDQSGAYKGLQLISMHSISKGFTGECGRRGGYFELCGFDDGVRHEIYKLASISLCANSTGQVLMGLQSVPPAEGEPSYALYAQERDNILLSLRRRATLLTAAVRELEGASCEESEGALYAFPRIRLPSRAIAAAKTAGRAPDAFYCRELLDETGIVLVPGSGFGQRDGTFHFRTTILPPEEEIGEVITLLKAFHKSFMQRYADAV